VHQDTTFFWPLSLPLFISDNRIQLNLLPRTLGKPPLAREERAEFIPWVARTKKIDLSTLDRLSKAINLYSSTEVYGVCQSLPA